MHIPKGITRIKLRDYRENTWVEEPVLCEIEVMMACFTKMNCRIRIKVLEEKAGYAEGEKRGNLDTELTSGILDIIYNGLHYHLKG